MDERPDTTPQEELGPQANGTSSPSRLPAGRHGLPREFVVNNQRARIIEAMARAVAEKGYARTSVADVLSRAGVSRKTFYERFSDKEDCFLQAYDVVADGLFELAEAAFREGSTEPWEVRVRHGLARTLEVMAAEPEFTKMCMVEGPAAGPAAMQRYFGILERFRIYVDQGREAADVEVPAFTAQAVVSGVAGVIYKRVAADRAAELPDVLPELTYFVVAPFLGRERAREQAELAQAEGR